MRRGGKRGRKVAIRSFRMRQVANKRFSVYLSTQIQGRNHYIAKLSARNRGWRTKFNLDKRTRTLRLTVNKRYAMGGQYKRGTKLGGNVAFKMLMGGRAAADQIVQRRGLYFKMSRWCLTPHGWNARENGILTWYHCQNKTQQKWTMQWYGRGRKTVRRGRGGNRRAVMMRWRRSMRTYNIWRMRYIRARKASRGKNTKRVQMYRRYFQRSRRTYLRFRTAWFKIRGGKRGRGGNRRAAMLRWRSSMRTYNIWRMRYLRARRASRGKNTKRVQSYRRYYQRSYRTYMRFRAAWFKIRGGRRGRKVPIASFRMRQVANKRFFVYFSSQQQGRDHWIAKLSARNRGWRTKFNLDSRTRTMRIT